MENNEYAVHHVKLVRKFRPRVPEGDFGDTVMLDTYEQEEEILTVVAPKGRLGLDLLGVHVRNRFAHAPEELVSWTVLSEQPVNTIIRYDDRYRGQV